MSATATATTSTRASNSTLQQLAKNSAVRFGVIMLGVLLLTWFVGTNSPLAAIEQIDSAMKQIV
jgi:hypothetical protein